MAALCAAVLAPLLLPSLNLLRLLPGQSSASGVRGRVGRPDPVAQLHGMLSQARPHTVLTYRSGSASPGQYFLVFVLNYVPRQAKWTLVPPGRTRALGFGPLLP